MATKSSVLMFAQIYGYGRDPNNGENTAVVDSKNTVDFYWDPV